MSVALPSVFSYLLIKSPDTLYCHGVKGVICNLNKLGNLHPSFSSRFPLDVIDKARMNS